MHPEDDSQTTLSKWPFILGDVLLVATALAIAILGHWQLTNWQVGACVAAVALGAALFILPYVVEFQVRIREEREDRAGDLRILEKHILNAEQAIDSADARIRALESAASEAGQPNAALAEAMDQKFAQLEAARAAQEEAIQALKKNLNELANKEPPPAFDPEVLKPIEKRLKALETKPKAVVEAPAPQKKEEAPAPPKAEPEKAEPEAPKPEPESKKEEPVKPEKTVVPVERPQRETRERHGPEEERLLKRAISENGDKSSTAVSRIIGSKAKEKDEAPAPEEPKSEPEEEEPKERVEPEKEEPKAEKPEPKKSEAKKEESEPKVEAVSEEAKPEPEAKPKATPAKPAKKEEPEAKPEPKAVEKEEPKPDPEAQDDSTDAESSETLFDEEKFTSPVARTKAKKNDAVLTASVFIGIGNKPYLRGGGAGLSWDKGLPMEFQEIGKWRWVAPSDLETPIELQIFRNDEDPDKSGKCTLEPGQKLEVTPVF